MCYLLVGEYLDILFNYFGVVADRLNEEDLQVGQYNAVSGTVSILLTLQTWTDLD